VAIEENRMDLPGVILEQEPVRRYTAGQAMSHVLGYLLSASPEDLRMYSGYRPDDLVGKAGIERAYEEYLRGQHGFQQVEVNALSRAIRQLGSVPPVPGHDLVLTVDAALQQAVMDIITRRLEELAADPDRTRPPGGAAVVVLDVRTGAVLALVSVPTYDNDRLLSEELTEYWRQLQEDRLSPMFNRALQGNYPPGSSFKPATLLAALGRGVTRPAAGPGRFQRAGHPARGFARRRAGSGLETQRDAGNLVPGRHGQRLHRPGLPAGDAFADGPHVHGHRQPRRRVPAVPDPVDHRAHGRNRARTGAGGAEPPGGARVPLGRAPRGPAGGGGRIPGHGPQRVPRLSRW